MSTRTSAHAVAFARLAIAAFLFLFISAGLHAQTCTPPVIVQQGGPVPICPGSPVTLDAGPGWAGYTWSNGASGQTMTVTPMMTTSYTVTVTDGGSCTVTSQPYEVEVEPVILVVNAPSEVCPTSANQAAVEPPPGGGTWVSVSWTIEHGWFNGQSGQSPTASGETVSFSADESGEPVVLTVTASDGLCTTETTKTVGLGEIDPPVINAPLEVCPSGAFGTASIAPPAAGGAWFSASWEITNGSFSGVSGPSPYASGTEVTFYADNSGQPVVLNVRAYDDQYCMAEASTTVGIRTIAPPVINAPLEVCPVGASGTASIAPPAAGGAWFHASWEITHGSFTGMYGPSPYASGTEVTFYADDSGEPVVLNVRAYDDQYCMSEASTTVGIRAIAPPVIAAPLEVCPAGASATASIAPPAAGGAWFHASWEITHGSFASPTGPSPYASGTEVTFYADDSGEPVVLKVRAYDDQYCMSEASTTVGIRAIAPPVISAPLEVCPSGASAMASIAPPAAGGAWFHASWEIANGSFAGLNGPSPYASGTEVTFYADDSGQPVVLNVRAYDGQFCMSEASTTVGIRAIAPPVISAPAEVCLTGSGAASVAPPAEGGAWFNVSWEITNGSFAGGTPFASGENVTFTADGSGSPIVLTARAYDGQYCASQATKSVAIATPTATITAGGPTTFCPGVQVQLTASAGASYLWSTGATTQSIWTSNGGDYTVTVTNANGCSATSAPMTLTVRDVVRPEIDTQAVYCTGSGNATATASGGSPVSYLWQIVTGGTIVGPSNGPTLTYTSTNTSGFIWLRLITTDAQGCTVIKSRDVPISNALAPSLSGPWAVCANDAGTVQVNDPRAGSTWQWSITNGVIDTIINSQTGQLDPNGDRVTFHPTIGAGTLTVTSIETNAAGCSKSAFVNVTVNAAPTTDFTITPACPAGPGSATASANPAFGQSFVWAVTNATITSGQGARTVNYMATGSDPVTITLTVTNNGTSPVCSKVVTKVSPVQTIAPPTIFKPAMACPGSTHSASVSSGLYDQVTWTVENANVVSTTATSVSYTPASTSGDIVITAVVRKGTCTNTATVTVPIADPVITAPASICPSGTVTVSYPTGYLGYSRTYTNAFYVSDGNHTITVRPDGSGLPIEVTIGFQITVSANSCWVYRTKVIPVVQTETPVIEWDVPANFCVGMSGSATITNREYSSYAWTVTGGTITGPANGSTINFVWSEPARNFTASVNVVDERGCAASGGSASPQANLVSFIWSSRGYKICPGQTTILSASQPNVDSYLWSTGATTPTIDVGTTGTYTVTTTKNGCSLLSEPITITAVTPVVNVTAPSGTTYCQGSSRTLNATYSNGTGRTPWFALHLASNGAYLGGNYSGVFTISATSSQGYFVRVTEDFNPTCVTNSSTVNFTVNPLPFATITPSGPTTFCQGGSVTLTAPAGMSSYSWSNGATTQAIAVSQSGNYTVTVTNANGCTASASRSVTVNPLPVATITPSGPTQFCEGGSVTLTGSAGQGWLWSNGATTQSINVTQPGAYTVRVTTNGCSTTSAATNVVVDARPSAVVTADGPTTFCEGGSVTLTAPESSSYSWSNGATTRSITVDASGAYSVTVTGANGCSATSTPVAVTENALPATPVIDAGGPTTFCDGGSVTLSAPAGFTYLWSNGATTQSINATTGGDYSVTITNASGCTATSAAVTVTVRPLPAANVTPSGPTTFCAGGSVTLTAGAAASYLWSTGATTQSIEVSTSGSYSVTVTSANGCSATSAATSVTVNALPAASISGPTAFCEGGSVTLTASAGASYLWSNGATTQSIVVSAAGDYSVTVTSAGGCSATSAATSVTMNALPAATVSASGPVTFCEGGSVTLTASAGAAYLWSNGAATQSIEVYASGSYSVTVTNAAGCSATSAATAVTVSALPAANITPSGPTTFCEGGSVTLTASAGASYLWSSGATTQSIDVTSTGSYSVTVAGGNGCSATSAATSVTVNPLPNLTISAGGPVSICQGGSVTLTGQGGGASGTWYRNGSFYSTLNPIVVTTAGSFVYRSQSAAGCQSESAPTVVTVNPLPSISSAGGHGSVCDNETAYWQVDNPTAGASILWTVTGGVIVSGQNDARLYYQAAPESASVHLDVQLTTPAGCTKSYSYDIPVNRPTPTITAGGPTTFCQGGSVTLTASAAPSGWTYLWSTGATTQAITVAAGGNYTVRYRSVVCNAPLSAPVTVTVDPLPSATITTSGPTTFCEGGSVTLTASAGASYLWSNGATTPSIDVTSSGSYSVTVTSAAGCSATSADTAVTVNAPPAASITPGGPTTFCAGGSVTLTASAGASYLWSTGATTQSINVTSSGGYSVTVTSAAGCSTTSAATAVTVNALPAATITPSGATTFCEGGSVTLTASAGSSYLWSNGATTSSIDVTSSGSYSVTVTNAAGCSTTSAATNVTVNALPAATITPSGATTFCEGGSVTLTASAGASYLWSNGATTSSIDVTSSGNYSVTITNAAGCSTTSAATNVTVNAPPAATITPSGATTFCEGGSVTLTASAGASYLWSNGATTSSIDVTSSGNYSVTVTNAAGCSTTSAATAVTVNALPAATITPSGPTTFCTGGSVTLTASSGSSYLWSTGATTQSINVTATGSYSVTVTNEAGCSATSAATAVTVNALPTATITPSGPTTFCTGGSVTLTATAGSSYLWSTGATTQSINVTSSGSYSVTVTNASGCSTTSAATAVTVNALPTATITPSGPTTFCTGGSVTLTASAGSSYLWSTGATTQSINVTSTGSYSVTVTNAAGCSATSAATAVTVNALPTATITPSGATTFCTGGSVTLTASAGASYLWSTGATTQSINVTTSGNYTVTVTSAAGCSATSAPRSVTVNANPSTPAITAGGPTTFCAGGSVTLTAPAGFTYLWSTGATTRSISATAGGNYTVTVTNGSGCSAVSAPTTVTVNPATAISQHPQSINIPKNTGTTLSVTASGTGLTYQWYRGTSPTTTQPISGATNSSYSTGNLTKGTYRYWVRVTGTCGVVNSNTATVVAN